MTNKPKKPAAMPTREEIGAMVREHAAEALTKELSEFDSDKFSQMVVQELKAQRSRVVWLLLGLDDRWGKWEVDHCNNRDSVINQYIAESVSPQVKAWLREAIEAEVIQARPALQKAVRRAVKDALDRKLDWEVRQQVRELTDAAVHDTVKSVTDEMFRESTRND